MRIGIGYDIHRLVRGRRLVLGGVEISSEKGLEGHSDADVVLHAVSDATLGALGLGDIGVYFPDTEPKYKDAPSTHLLMCVNGLINREGYSVNNVDTVIIIEEPKINPFFAEMKRRISNILQIDQSCVGIKATTNEGLGSIGRGEAIASWAVVTLKRNI